MKKKHNLFKNGFEKRKLDNRGIKELILIKRELQRSLEKWVPWKEYNLKVYYEKKIKPTKMHNFKMNNYSNNFETCKIKLVVEKKTKIMA